MEVGAGKGPCEWRTGGAGFQGSCLQFEEQQALGSPVGLGLNPRRLSSKQADQHGIKSTGPSAGLPRASPSSVSPSSVAAGSSLGICAPQFSSGRGPDNPAGVAMREWWLVLLWCWVQRALSRSVAQSTSS